MNIPKRQSVSFSRCEGYYDILRPNKKHVQYIFHFNFFADRAKELGLKASYLIELDEDGYYDIENYSTLDLANELLDIYNSYWINTSKDDIAKVKQFLEDIDEENKRLELQDKINEAKYKIEYWQKKLAVLENDLEEYNNE